MRGSSPFLMACEEVTLRVTGTAFAPVGAEVVWKISSTKNPTFLKTYITDKDNANGTITLLYDTEDLPPGISSISCCDLILYEVSNKCGIGNLMRPLLCPAS